MGILTNYVKNEHIEKGWLLQASDWILTPYRSLLGGKDVEIILMDNGTRPILKEKSEEHSPFLKVIYAVTIVVIAPLALIAALLKRHLLSPPLLTITITRIMTTKNEIERAISAAAEIGLAGRIELRFVPPADVYNKAREALPKYLAKEEQDKLLNGRIKDCAKELSGYHFSAAHFAQRAIFKGKRTAQFKLEYNVVLLDDIFKQQKESSHGNFN